MLTFKGRKVAKGNILTAEALVSKEPISFFGGVDPLTGILTEKGHELEGKKITGKILVYPTGKGSTGGSYILCEMVYRKTAPAALVNLEAEPITVIGAILGNIPMIDRVKNNFFDLVKNGDLIDIHADKGTIHIKKVEGV